MSYTFQFGPILAAWPTLLGGALATLRLTFLAIMLGMAIAILCAAIRLAHVPIASFLVKFYVEVIRNTPLLIQAYLVFFGLPMIGIRLSGEQAAVLALTVNLAAYATEIIRSGIDAVPKGQSEAASALGLSKRYEFRKIILPQAIQIVFPALQTQFVIILLASSLMSAISMPELTAVTNSLQSKTFLSFEAYIVSAVIYLVMAAMCLAAFELIGRLMFGVGQNYKEALK